MCKIKKNGALNIMTDNQTIPPEEEKLDAPEEGQATNRQGNSETPSEELASRQAAARLERLGGEPAPDISPEEFARLQQSGQIHIDPRGRVRSPRHGNSDDAGVSLRKRRAWY